MFIIAERVAGCCILQPDRGGDITGIAAFNIFSVIGVHLQDAADPFALPLDGIHNGGPRLERAGIDTEKRQPADIGIRHNFECKR